MPDDRLVYPDLRLDRFDFDASTPQREYADAVADDDNGSTVPITVVPPTTSNNNLWPSSSQQTAPLESSTVRYQAPDHSNNFNNHLNEHPSSSASSSPPPPAHIILVAILMALIFILVAILIYLLLPLVGRCIGAKLARSPRRIQRRYETIEGWLITKKVRAHCPTCEQLQQQYKTNHSNSNATTTISTKSKAATTTVTPSKADPNRNVQLSPSYDTAETEPMEDFDDEDGCHDNDDDDNYFQHECTICYEALAEGDMVSWSPQPPTHLPNRPKEASCQHVFHHECIKEWLLHHDTCPCCRITYLPIDQSHSCNTNNNSGQNDDDETTTNGSNNNNNKSRAYWGSKAVQRKLQLRNWVEQRSHRLKTTYYCLQEGLVTLNVAVPPDGGGDGECHSKKQQSRFVGSGISPAVLARLRTSRSLTIPAATTASSSPSVQASEIIHRPQHNNSNSHLAPAATNPSPPMHPVSSSSSPLVVLINRCHSAPSSTNSTAAPQPLSVWRSRTPAWRGSVDLDLCLQQLHVLDGRQGFPFRSSISGSSSSDDDDDEVAEEGLYLESSSTSNGGSSTSSSNSVVSSTSPPPPPLQQHLHMSHVVVGDIEMCLMKQQEQNQQQQQRPVDWESASF